MLSSRKQRLSQLKKAPGAGIAHINELIKLNNDQLHFGGVKFISDGSIQGFTARLKWPGYFNGAKNGLFDIPPVRRRG